MAGRLARHLRRHQVRRLAHVRDRRHHRWPDVRDPVPRHPDRQGRLVDLQGPVRHQGRQQRSPPSTRPSTCSADNKTITFNLNQPVGDFNYTVTLGLRRGAEGQDTGVKYDRQAASRRSVHDPVATSRATTSTLVRNPNWDPASDTYRPAYPDKIVVKFGVDPAVIDQRLIKDARRRPAADQLTTSSTGGPADGLRQPGHGRPPAQRPRPVLATTSRSTSEGVRTSSSAGASPSRSTVVPCSRSPVATTPVALATVPIKPNIGVDYAPTGMWNGLLGKTIPLSGDPAYAKQLIAESGKPMPTIVYSYRRAPTRQGRRGHQVVARKAGINGQAEPDPGRCRTTASSSTRTAPRADQRSGWGPDWPNASTVIPPLFTPTGGFDLSYVDDAAFNSQGCRGAGRGTDRTKQSTAVAGAQQGRPRRTSGSSRPGSRSTSASPAPRSTRRPATTAHVYLWAPYGSWPYTDLYVTQ